MLNITRVCVCKCFVVVVVTADVRQPIFKRASGKLPLKCILSFSQMKFSRLKINAVNKANEQHRIFFSNHFPAHSMLYETSNTKKMRLIRLGHLANLI